MEGKDLRSSLHSLRDHQEQSLKAIQEILDTFEVAAVPPAHRSAKSQQSTGSIKSFQQTQTSSRLFCYDIQYSKERNSVSSIAEDASDPHSKISHSSRNLQNMIQGSRFKAFLKGSNENFEDINFKDLRAVCRWIVNKPQFDWLMGIIIFVNSVCIGIDTQKSISTDWLPHWPGEVIDWMFISVYCVEILMRSLAFGRANFLDGWFLFDLLLVSMGIFGNVINLMLRMEGENHFQTLLVFRAFRLLRLVRVDGRGQLSVVEFADGLLGLLTMDVPVHTMKIFKLLHLHSQTLEQIKTKLGALSRSMRSTFTSPELTEAF